MNALAKYLFLLLICVLVCLTGKIAFAAGPVDATCEITVTVDEIVEWEGANFAAIDLDSEASISAQAHSPEGSAVYTLWLNGDITLSADNAGDTAQLEQDGAGTDVLVTKYKISTDGDGDPASGADATAISNSGSDGYLTHDLFLDTGLVVTHVANDGAVEVTLEVEGTNDPAGHKEVANADTYTANQTITATWVP